VIRFEVAHYWHAHKTRTRPLVVLVPIEDWNDFGFYTLFNAHLVDGAEQHVKLGSVKILRRGMSSGRPTLPIAIAYLDDSYCSLGQDADYYLRFRDRLGEESDAFLEALRDAAVSPVVAEAFRNEPGFEKSLLRFPSAQEALKNVPGLLESLSHSHSATDTSLEGRLPGLAAGDHGTLKFRTTVYGFDGPHELTLRFARTPLGRIFALVGKNGTGKTIVLARLASCIAGFTPGRDYLLDIDKVIALSFSALDQFTRPRPRNERVEYVYCGLRPPGRHSTARGEYLHEVRERALQRLRSAPAAFRSFTQTIEKSGLQDLDPRLDELLRRSQPQDWIGVSSGHQLIVTVLATLAAEVRPNSVVLFDEPELHLHPNLLSYLLRMMADLLDVRDAFCVLTTHSPIPLQELPGRSIAILERSGRTPIVSDYPGQSFGESLGEIVQLAFRAGESDVNFVTSLQRLAEARSRGDIETLLGGKLSLPVRLILDALRARGDE
jgi:predicted ATPase